MFERVFSKLRPVIAALLLMLGLALCLTSRTRVGAPANYFWQTTSIQTLSAPDVSTSGLFNGKLASLGWIVGRDCQRGLHAYLQTASTNPDAALVGTGWVNPTNGKLINGESNNCIAGSLSMDNVVQLVHSKGGMAYLTITMMTDGTAGAWTSQQQSDYIAKATTDQSYIDPIVHEVMRAHYDGVIMDMEAGSRSYPDIQHLFATYNQHVWAALKPLHKWYGIALIHKLSNQDDYYNLNGFENWSLLAHCADFIVIMAVDQSYFTPGPTVSIPWLKQLLAYALQTMPAMLPRIIWELPLYGATWHRSSSGWVFDGGANYQDAQVLAERIPASEIDTSASNLNDVYAAHIVYTDSSGVKHALWYHTARNLYRIITEFQHILEQVPQFNRGHLKIAVWYRATWEPGDLWAMLDPVLSN
jgi:spore germination protein YaaH